MHDTHPIYVAGTHRQRCEIVNDVVVRAGCLRPAVGALCGTPRTLPDRKPCERSGRGCSSPATPDSGGNLRATSMPVLSWPHIKSDAQGINAARRARSI